MDGTNTFLSVINETIHLICTVVGSPEPEVTWYLNGGNISNNITLKNTTKTSSEFNFNITRTITLTPVVPGDSGNIYRCTASNERTGSSSASVQIIVCKYNYICCVLVLQIVFSGENSNCALSDWNIKVLVHFDNKAWLWR